MKKLFLGLVACAVITTGCKKNTSTPATETPSPDNACPAASCIHPDTVWPGVASGPQLVFKFKFDSTQVRLNNLGQASTVPAGNAAISPKFNRMSAHYIELAANDVTPLGGGTVLYKANETTCGGQNAITFCQSVVVREGVTFFSIPLSQLSPGTYKWCRVSLAYQNYDIPYKVNGIYGVGTLASFLGFRTYVSQYTVKNQAFVPSPGTGGPGNHAQGYWGFETSVAGTTYTVDGQAAGTTVVNPLFASSPIPAGSCVVTGEFTDMAGSTQLLTITGNETQNIVITVSLSTNKSFEWHEVVADGYYEPGAGEAPVDMGVRGLIPKVQY